MRTGAGPPSASTWRRLGAGRVSDSDSGRAGAALGFGCVSAAVAFAMLATPLRLRPQRWHADSFGQSFDAGAVTTVERRGCLRLRWLAVGPRLLWQAVPGRTAEVLRAGPRGSACSERWSGGESCVFLPRYMVVLFGQVWAAGHAFNLGGMEGGEFLDAEKFK